MTTRNAAAGRRPDASAKWLELFVDLVVIGAAEDLDLGDLISAGLAKAAEELGGVSHVIATRPGSWEAQHLLHLALGKLGPDSADMDVKPH